MDKPLCDWCGKEEYHIGILKDDKEELICKTCFKKIILKNSMPLSENNTEVVRKSQ